MTITSEPWLHPQPRFRLVMVGPDLLHALARGEGAGLPVTRFVFAPGQEASFGLAGFHGPPDSDGMVEVGYRIDPNHRREGSARLALETLA